MRNKHSIIVILFLLCSLCRHHIEKENVYYVKCKHQERASYLINPYFKQIPFNGILCKWCYRKLSCFEQESFTKKMIHNKI